MAQTECDCVKRWEFKGSMYSGCDPAAPKDKKPWCYITGDPQTCPDSKESTVKKGEFWKYCAAAAAAEAGSQSVTHMVIVSQDASAGGAAGAAASDLNPNEPPADVPAPAAPAEEDEDVPPAKPQEDEEMTPLTKTMSEGKLLRKLWAEMNQIEALIHAANVDLKARLIKAFKVVRTRMVQWEKMKDDTSGKKTEGQRLRGMWAAMGAIEDEIHEINLAMKKRLQGLIEALRKKMHIFDAAAARIDRMRAAMGKTPSSTSGSAASIAGAGSMGGSKPGAGNPCPPGEVAIAGDEGQVSCSVAPNSNNMAPAVPHWRRHLQEDALSLAGEMGPLVKTVSEGAKLRALWAELGGIEKEIHETNLVLKKRLLAAFKVIRARMANWEKEGNPDKKKSEGARLRAQWAELGHVEEEIHITNQEMKRRLRRVIRVIKEKMEHFENGANEAKKLAGKENPNKPGRAANAKVPSLGLGLE